MSTATIEGPAAAHHVGLGSHRLRPRLRGRAGDPAWYRPLLLALLAATAIAYLVNLTASGDANSFYAAAVQAGTKSWKAFFFGSIDSSNFITVDKPPASLWVMELSGRIFGFSSASMLVPEVLEGVLSVGLLAAAVKRWFGSGAGLLAGLGLAVTPVAALMFRFNNPDALMVCLMVGAAYCLVRAVEVSSTRWLLGVGVCLGFAFLAKMMEAFLVVPGFGLVYVVAAPGSVRRRIVQLIGALAAMLASAGWWVATVALWPAASRPMIDGSPSNSILNLIWDYNGLGRLTGNESGTSVGTGSGGSGGSGGLGGGFGGHGGGGGANFSGSTGIFRLFNDVMGGQASWLLPAALIVLVAGLIWRGRRPRTDRMRAGLLLWGSWLVVCAVCFSFSQGTIHTYYTVALAPPAAALVGLGAAQGWRRRSALPARLLLGAGVAATAGWSVVLLGRDSGWQPWLTPLVIVCAVLGVAGLLIPGGLRTRMGATPSRLLRHVSSLAAVLAAIACLAGPAAYAAETISTAHTGSTPSAGPSTGSGFGGFGRAGRAGGFGPFSRSAGSAGAGGSAGSAGSAGSTGSAGSAGSAGAVGSAGSAGSAGRGTASGATGSGRSFAGGGRGSATAPNAALDTLLEHSTGYRWAAATDGSQSAASLELASNGSPVMAIGGFSGLGGQITLAAFEKDVKAGDIHYFIASSGFGGGAGMGGAGFGGGAATASASTSAPSGGLSSLFGGAGGSPTDATGAASGSTGSASGSTGSASGSTGSATARFGGAAAGGPGGRSSGSESEILAWVKAHYHSQTVGGTTVYDLSDPLS